MKKLVLFLISLFLITSTALAANITGCTSLGTTGTTYNLGQDVLVTGTSGACFDVTASNVTLDCGNKSVSLSTGTRSAIRISANNFTLKNCTIEGFVTAIEFNSGNNVSIGVLGGITNNFNDNDTIIDFARGNISNFLFIGNAVSNSQRVFDFFVGSGSINYFSGISWYSAFDDAGDIIYVDATNYNLDFNFVTNTVENSNTVLKSPSGFGIGTFAKLEMYLTDNDFDKGSDYFSLSKFNNLSSINFSVTPNNIGWPNVIGGTYLAGNNWSNGGISETCSASSQYEGICDSEFVVFTKNNIDFKDEYPLTANVGTVDPDFSMVSVEVDPVLGTVLTEDEEILIKCNYYKLVGNNLADVNVKVNLELKRETSSVYSEEVINDASLGSSSASFTYTPIQGGDYTATCSLELDGSTDINATNNIVEVPFNVLEVTDPNDFEAIYPTPASAQVNIETSFDCGFKKTGDTDLPANSQVVVNFKIKNGSTELLSETATILASDQINGIFTTGQTYSNVFNYTFENKGSYTTECGIIPPTGQNSNVQNDARTKTVNVTGARVDFAVIEIDIPDEAEKGEEIEIECTIANIGGFDANEGELDIYLYVDDGEGGHDLSNDIESFYIDLEDDDLKSNEDESLDFKFTIDDDMEMDDDFEVKCEIDYTQERDNVEEFTEINTSNNSMTIEEENYIEKSKVDLIIDNLSIATTPVYVDVRNSVTCKVENIGKDMPNKKDYDLIITIDGEEFKTEKEDGDLDNGDTESFTKTWTPTRAGTADIKCEVDYESSEESTSNNDKSMSVVVRYEGDDDDTTPDDDSDNSSNNPSSGDNTGNNNTGNNTGNSNTGNFGGYDSTLTGTSSGGYKQYILKVSSLNLGTYEDGKVDLTCNFSNDGDGDLTGYKISFTHNDVVKGGPFEVNSSLAPGQSSTYTMNDMQIGDNGGIVGCLVQPINGTKSAAQYVTLDSNSSNAWTTIILIVLILVILGIVYLIYRELKG
jgi:hypothetical protein